MLTMLSLLIALLSATGQEAAAPESATAPTAPGDSVRVVELFTSQGCPKCPSANALLETLADENADVLALAYGVDYWNIYGWEDTFARPEFVARQRAYVDAGESRRAYTPHFVINGSPEKLRFDEPRIADAVEGADELPIFMTVESRGEQIFVTLDGALASERADIWAVAYFPGRETVTVERGPNAGREMSHYNMVRTVERAGAWTGGALTLELQSPGDGLATAILVQEGPGGRILTAARLVEAEA